LSTFDINCSNSSCVFNKKSGYEPICSDCEKLLIKESREEDGLRLTYLSYILKHHSEFSDSLTSAPFGEAISKIGIKVKEKVLVIKAAQELYNNYAARGTNTRNWLETSATEIYANKKLIEANYSQSPTEKVPFLIAARRWNSWTPSLPVKNQSIPTASHDHEKSIESKIYRKTGGGYFLSDGEFTLVIDPGFGFLKMMYESHDLTVMDIDAIIITHDHPDHLAELHTILGLRHVYRKKCNKKIKVYLNPSSHFLYSRVCLYYSHLLYMKKAIKLPANKVLNINSFQISTIGMFHDEIWDKLEPKLKEKIKQESGDSAALGLIVNFVFNRKKYKISIPGDTSFPKNKEEWARLASFYADSDIACVHLGSIEEKWTDPSINLPIEVQYGDRGHLGITGVVNLLSSISPHVAIITEFGEELDFKKHRLSVVEIIKEVLSTFKFTIIPSDNKLKVVIVDGLITGKCSCEEGYYVPIEKLNYYIDEDGYIIYNYAHGCDSKLEHYKL
jgi:L-ascorbate metabolism protein UlaG (beta-lactamase superfamily)